MPNYDKTDHIDQLKEWWEAAEIPTSDSLPRDGDRIIYRYNSEWYEIATSRGDAEASDLFAGMRILTRAPKPAWHDAAAVVARSVNAPEGHREVFFRSEATPGVWIGEGGYGYSDDLRDVTPLIEAKVTDEMVLKALNDKWGLSAPSLYHYSEEAVSVTRDMISAALRIESE